MVNKTRIKTDAAPPAIGTYSQAIRTGDLVFVTAAKPAEIPTPASWRRASKLKRGGCCRISTRF